MLVAAEPAVWPPNSCKMGVSKFMGWVQIAPHADTFQLRLGRVWEVWQSLFFFLVLFFYTSRRLPQLSGNLLLGQRQDCVIQFKRPAVAFHPFHKKITPYSSEAKNKNGSTFGNHASSFITSAVSE